MCLSTDMRFRTFAAEPGPDCRGVCGYFNVSAWLGRCFSLIELVFLYANDASVTFYGRLRSFWGNRAKKSGSSVPHDANGSVYVNLIFKETVCVLVINHNTVTSYE